jgi:16S rRNA (uracil1498-N3)-methyltransferase
MRRFYLPTLTESDRTVTLRGEEFHHLAQVLRLKPGDTVTLFDGKGQSYLGRIEALTQNEARVTIREKLKIGRESPLELVLGQGAAKADKMEFVIQKATELGVSRIIPLITSRTVVQLSGGGSARKIERWRRIALEAVKQCGRSRIPDVDEPQPFSEVLKSWEGFLKLTPWEGSEPRPPTDEGKTARPLREVLRERGSQNKVILLIGPEGGFSFEEVDEARSAGFIPVSLGPRILRTETAAVTALSLLQYEWGDL